VRSRYLVAARTGQRGVSGVVGARTLHLDWRDHHLLCEDGDVYGFFLRLVLRALLRRVGVCDGCERARSGPTAVAGRRLMTQVEGAGDVD
jgi:hypothetical protein